jgi:DNA-binding NarL/FixJ family response regulator
MDPSLLLIYHDRKQAAPLKTVLTSAIPEVVLTIAINTQEARRCPKPRMILLDLDHTSRFKILKWLRCEEIYKPIPVIALTSAAGTDEVNQAYELGINSCVLKSANGIAFEVARGIGTYLKVLSTAHYTD